MKESLGILAIIITFIGYVPYVKSMLEGQTKPHAFSWIIWGISTLIVFIAQFLNGGGAGSWSIGISAIVTFGIAIFAYYKNASSDHTTKSDWVCLTTVLFAIPLWYATSDPLYSVIIVVFIDICGYFPTLRKAYYKPFEEQILMFFIMSVRNVFAIMALDVFSFLNLLFSVATGIANFVVIGLIIIRRKKVEKHS